VADLDQSGKVQGGKPLAVAQRPVVAATHARAGDPDHAAQNDEAECQYCSGPGQAAEGGGAFGLVY